jgi:hypothetical protein
MRLQRVTDQCEQHTALYFTGLDFYENQIFSIKSKYKTNCKYNMTNVVG